MTTGPTPGPTSGSTPAATTPAADPSRPDTPAAAVPEIGGRKGPDPTRYGDWENDGRCVDF
ncbi:MAG: DUF1674 domain-containing protein [Alphaproteobacteria bacterium]|nr:DUF1674 domain-containing protein [Alphaproteobacteria bacterium]